MSVVHKISGFITAVILAIVSFFIIYLFCPHFSQKAFGVSMRKDVPVAEVPENTMKKTVDKTIDKTEKVVKNVTEKIEKIDLSHLLDD